MDIVNENFDIAINPDFTALAQDSDGRLLTCLDINDKAVTDELQCPYCLGTLEPVQYGASLRRIIFRHINRASCCHDNILDTILTNGCFYLNSPNGVLYDNCVHIYNSRIDTWRYGISVLIFETDDLILTPDKLTTRKSFNSFSSQILYPKSCIFFSVPAGSNLSDEFLAKMFTYALCNGYIPFVGVGTAPVHIGINSLNLTSGIRNMALCQPMTTLRLPSQLLFTEICSVLSEHNGDTAGSEVFSTSDFKKFVQAVHYNSFDSLLSDSVDLFLLFYIECVLRYRTGFLIDGQSVSFEFESFRFEDEAVLCKIDGKPAKLFVKQDISNTTLLALNAMTDDFSQIHRLLFPQYTYSYSMLLALTYHILAQTEPVVSVFDNYLPDSLVMQWLIALFSDIVLLKTVFTNANIKGNYVEYSYLKDGITHIQSVYFVKHNSTAKGVVSLCKIFSRVHAEGASYLFNYEQLWTDLLGIFRKKVEFKQWLL